MNELVFRLVCEITYADWLPTGPTFYDVGPAQYTTAYAAQAGGSPHFSSRPGLSVH